VITDAATYAFRWESLGTLAPMGGRLEPTSEDVALVTCPACGGTARIVFHRSLPEADLTCCHGCPDSDLRKAIGQRRAVR